MRHDHIILLATGAALAGIGIASSLIWIAVLDGWLR